MNPKLTSLLRDAPVFADARNLYARDTAGDIRFANLQIFITRMQALKPKYFMSGEAPGYQGTTYTGVPWTSEFLLLRQNSPHGLHGLSLGYELLSDSDSAKLKKEPSATIVWRVFDLLPTPPMSWAAFPMHPHKPGNERSNRAPNKQELQYGQEVLKEMLAMFPTVKEIIAVGNVSEKTLRDMGYNPKKVRHPSHGGATDFARQMTEIMAG